MYSDSKMTELGYFLRSYRAKNNISQRELAENMGVGKNTVYLWESGATRPSIASLVKLSELFGEPLISVIEMSKNLYYQVKI